MPRAPLLLLLVLALPSALAQGWPSGAYNPYGHDPVTWRLDLPEAQVDLAPYVAAVERAFAWWEEGGNGALRFPVRFQRVEANASADVLVQLVDGAFVCGNPRAAGCARFGNETVPGEIVLALRTRIVSPDGTRSEERYVPYEGLARVAEHEIGHAMGLPHSDDAGDIMWPENDMGLVAYGDGPESTWFIRNGVLVFWVVVTLGLGGFVAFWWRLSRAAKKEREEKERRQREGLPP